EVVLVTRSKSELAQGAGVGNDFALPALVGLEFAHRSRGPGVPNSGWLTVKVAFADQGFLNFASPIAGDLLLSVALPRRSAQLAETRVPLRRLPTAGFWCHRKSRHAYHNRDQKRNADFLELSKPHKLLLFESE